MGSSSSQHTKNSEVFRSAYGKLNSAQREAVDAIEGPVMVVAGPGTGKTQVLALRVANILERTQMRPQNILCLTFSKSGATAMRKRLKDIIGPAAYGVTVNTIHGFCNDIISRHPNVFEEWSALTQISDIERYREINKIIDSLMPDCVLVSKKYPYIRTKDIISSISALKKEAKTDPEILRGIADDYEEEMSVKSKEGTKAHKNNLLRARKFRDFLTVFFRYQEMLQATGRYDYDDMILNVIRALEQEDWLLSELQVRYQYLLTDEFQDTNGAQYRILELLTEDPTGDASPNIFVVGDDDQAIYRFQGANLKNILSFHSRFPKAKVVALTESYRCTQAILDAADSLIRSNMERLEGRIPGLEKRLKSVKTEAGEQPMLLLSPSDMSEPWMIADLIQERMHRGIAPQSIAVLVQTNAELKPIYDVLRSRDIPVEMSGKLDLLSHPVIKQLLCILRAVHVPSDTSALANALGCACFNCHPADLSKLYQYAYREKISLLEVLLKPQMPEDTTGADVLLHARDTVLSLHHQLASRTVVDTIEHAIKECGLLKSENGGVVDIMDLAVVQEFFDRVKERAYEQPGFSYESYLSDLSFYENPDYGDIRLTYNLPHLIENGVQLMTAHRSKGLEFHTVIIANFREGHWDKRKTPSALSLPEELLFGWHKDQKDFEKNQDERRVAFVAITRAESELIFTCPEELTTGESLKSVSPSGFFSECGKLPEAKRDVLNPTQMSTLLAPAVRKFDLEMEVFLRKRLEQFSLSPTALNDFVQDPTVFLERHLLRIPQAKDATLSYGNAVHHALAEWASRLQSGTPMTKAELLAFFSFHLDKKEFLVGKEFTRLNALGHETLQSYFEAYLQPPYPIVHKVEYTMTARLGDIPLKGKIDRMDLIEPNSSKVIITDYKTGKPKSPKQITDFGYFRQLVFYALLAEQDPTGLHPESFVLEFVGEADEDPVRRIFTVSETDKKELRDLIERVWTKIIALDFSPL